MSPSNTFRKAFLKTLISLREVLGLGVGVTSTPDEDDSKWWASWHVEIEGRTYVLNLIPLSMTERSFAKAPNNEDSTDWS